MILTDNRQQIKKNAEEFIRKIQNGVYILGINKYGKAVMKFLEGKRIPVQGFVDDFTSRHEYEGYSIFKISDLPPNEAVINCIVDGRPVDAIKKLSERAIIQHIDYYSLQSLYKNELPEIDYLSETDSIGNNSAYNELYLSLADEESKVTLEKVANFRFNRDVNEMRSFAFRTEEQYFEDFIHLPPAPVFVDGGGFNGITSQKFAELYPDFTAIYIFEPNEHMLAESRELLKEHENVSYFRKGLWKSAATLSFDSSQGPASKISTQGSSTIELVALDEIIPGRADFIKLDVEGAEVDAILGAEKLIRVHKPVMAVCVYHHQHHFIEIPALLKSFNPDYKIYLRHYTQGIMETVMFFV